MFATQRGLDVHITKTKGRSCELLVRMAKKKKEIAERNLRNSKLSQVKFKSLGSIGRVPVQRRKSGKRLTKENKEDIIKNYNYSRGDKISATTPRHSPPHRDSSFSCRDFINFFQPLREQQNTSRVTNNINYSSLAPHTSRST